MTKIKYKVEPKNWSNVISALNIITRLMLMLIFGWIPAIFIGSNLIVHLYQ
jgi:hypothetical protein